ncbi:MAG: methyltransferase domain-containing protein [Candidatus ainarchaeum sp.]|nr:methyltransferase domain-containing protein [Candidatus ainarchaeum sp.]
MDKILITPYVDPDLDGSACAYAYSEFLVKQGVNAVGAVFGNIHNEAKFVFNKFKIPKLQNAENIVNKIDKIILVDASDLQGISKKIDPNKVIEIIDHRKAHEADSFPNAKKQIELVGSAATLIAEKYYSKKLTLSKGSAALLYSAIVSNTINFRANVTTDRDIKMANWLKSQLSLPNNYIRDMFEYKSKIRGSLKKQFSEDLAIVSTNDLHLGIVQFELVGVDSFLEKNIESIKKNLLSIKAKHNFDFVFLTCIDIEKGFNKFVAIDKETQEIVEKNLTVKFKNGITKRKGIIMRKEIIPIIKAYLESKTDKSKAVAQVYDKIAKPYAKEFSRPSDYIDNFLAYVPKKGKILDIGCGPGFDSAYFNSKGFQVVGVDLSKEMLVLAKKKCPKGEFICEDFRKITFPSNSFDGIFASCSLIHIPKKDVLPALKLFYKILKKDSVIYIALQGGKPEEIFLTEPLKPDEKVFLNVMELNEIIGLLDKAGFSIVEKYTRKPVSKAEWNFEHLFVIAKKK